MPHGTSEKLETKKDKESGFRSLVHPINCSLPSSSVHESSQARILEWVAISFSKGSEVEVIVVVIYS